MYLQSKISRLFFYFHQIHSNSSSVIDSFGFFFHLGSLHLFSSHSVLLLVSQFADWVWVSVTLWLGLGVRTKKAEEEEKFPIKLYRLLDSATQWSNEFPAYVFWCWKYHTRTCATEPPWILCNYLVVVEYWYPKRENLIVDWGED